MWSTMALSDRNAQKAAAAKKMVKISKDASGYMLTSLMDLR